MPLDASHQTFPCSEELLRSLGDRDFRHGYLEDHVRTNIAFQIHALRSQRGWTQQKLADEAKKPANGISRLEDPDYGKVTLTTLVEMAEAFDVALLVQFVEWDDWLTRMADVSPAALEKRSFDLARLMALRRPQHPALQVTSDKRKDDALGTFPTVKTGRGLGSPRSEERAAPQRGYEPGLSGRQGSHLMGTVL